MSKRFFAILISIFLVFRSFVPVCTVSADTVADGTKLYILMGILVSLGVVAQSAQNAQIIGNSVNTYLDNAKANLTSLGNSAYSVSSSCLNAIKSYISNIQSAPNISNTWNISTQVASGSTQTSSAGDDITYTSASAMTIKCWNKSYSNIATVSNVGGLEVMNTGVGFHALFDGSPVVSLTTSEFLTGLKYSVSTSSAISAVPKSVSVTNDFSTASASATSSIPLDTSLTVPAGVNWDSYVGTSSSGVDNLVDVGSSTGTGTGTGTVSTDYTGVLGTIQGILQDIWDFLKSILQSILNAITSIPSLLQGLWDFLKSILQSILDAILSVPISIENWFTIDWGIVRTHMDYASIFTAHFQPFYDLSSQLQNINSNPQNSDGKFYMVIPHQMGGDDQSHCVLDLTISSTYISWGRTIVQYACWIGLMWYIFRILQPKLRL